MDTYEDLFQKASASHWLRSSKGTTSCKMSALHYILIHLMMGKVKPARIPILIKKIAKDETLNPLLSNHAVGGVKIKDTSFYPSKIMFETNTLTPKEYVMQTIEDYINIGYSVESFTYDAANGSTVLIYE
jgi:hypothetical protein